MADNELTFIGYLPPKCGVFMINDTLIQCKDDNNDASAFLWQNPETKEFVRKPNGKHAPNHPSFQIPMKVEQAFIAPVGDSLLIENGNTLIIPYEGYCLVTEDDYSFWVFDAEQNTSRALGVILPDENTVFKIHTTSNVFNLKWTQIRGKTTYPPGFTRNGVTYSKGLEIFQNDKYVITHDIGKDGCGVCVHISKYRCIPIDQFYSTMPEIDIIENATYLPLRTGSVCSCSNVHQIIYVEKGRDWSEFYIADTTWWPQQYFDIVAFVNDNITYLVSKNRVIGTMRRFSFAPTDRDYEISYKDGLALNIHNVENFGSVFGIIHAERDDYRENKLGFNLSKNYSMSMVRGGFPAIFRPGEIMGELVYAFTVFDNYDSILQDFSIYTANEEKLDLTFTTCIKSIREFTPDEDKIYNGVVYNPQDVNGFCIHIHESLPGTFIIEDDGEGTAVYQNIKPINNIKPVLRED